MTANLTTHYSGSFRHAALDPASSRKLRIGLEFDPPAFLRDHSVCDLYL